MLQMLRLINPPGHRRRSPWPGYARPNPRRRAAPIGGGPYRGYYESSVGPRAAAADSKRRFLASLTPAERREYLAMLRRTRRNPYEPLPFLAAEYRARRKQAKKVAKRRRTAAKTNARRNPMVSRNRLGRFTRRRRNPAASNPRRRRRARRNPYASATVVGKKGTRKIRFYYAKPKSKKAQAHARGLATRLVAVPTTSAGRKAALAELARTYGARRVGHRSKRRWSTRARRWVKKTAPRRKTVAKRKHTKKSARRPARRSKKSYRAAALKGWRKKGRKTARRVSRRRRSSPITLTVRSRRRIRMRRTPRGRYRTGVLRASYRGKRRRGHLTVKWVRRNPTMASLKDALISGAAMYGGFLGMRALTVVLKENVINQITALQPTSTTNVYVKKAMACIPQLAVFGLSMFAGKFITNPKVLGGIQTGATLVLFDALFSQFVLPRLGTATKYFQPVSGFYGYGGEYIRQRTPLPYQGYGAMAREAVAEYVQQPGMGAYDVNEALAGSEVQAMQTGYAAGSLAKTVFSS